MLWIVTGSVRSTSHQGAISFWAVCVKLPRFPSTAGAPVKPYPSVDCTVGLPLATLTTTAKLGEAPVNTVTQTTTSAVKYLLLVMLHSNAGRGRANVFLAVAAPHRLPRRSFHTSDKTAPIVNGPPALVKHFPTPREKTGSHDNPLVSGVRRGPRRHRLSRYTAAGRRGTAAH